MWLKRQCAFVCGSATAQIMTKINTFTSNNSFVNTGQNKEHNGENSKHPMKDKWN